MFIYSYTRNLESKTKVGVFSEHSVYYTIV